MTSYSNTFLFDKINEMLEIDFDSTTDDESVDNKTIKQLESIWHSLDGVNYDRDYFEIFSEYKKKENFFKIIKLLENKSNNLKNQILLNFEKYISNFNKYNSNLLTSQNFEIILGWILLTFWSQHLISKQPEFLLPIFITIFGYLSIEKNFFKNSLSDYKKYLNYCYKRLCQKVEPYDQETRLLNNLIEILEKYYPKENYLIIYNRIIYLVKIRMELNSLHIENFPYENIEKGYSIFDILLFIIFSDNPEEIDQQKQNFFALFGIYIKIVSDIKNFKNKNNGYFKRCINSGFNLDSIVIKLLNLIKILEEYLNKTSFFNQDLIQSFKLININILYYSLYDNSDIISPKLFEFIKKRTWIEKEHMNYLINYLYKKYNNFK